MGLAINVFMLAEMLEEDPEPAEWIESEMATVNRLLAASGLPKHTEPRVMPEYDTRASIVSFPYSFIHYLRRAYAHRRVDAEWMAEVLPEHVDPSDDPVLDAEYDYLASHLVCHSDAEGYYVPVEFDDVLFSNDEIEVAGGMLGSSYRLLDELITVAPALGIKLEAGELSDEEALRVAAIGCEGEGLTAELCSWLSLYEAAKISVRFKTAIVFS